MEMKEVIRKLDLGMSVAEFDDALESYFVETEAFRALIQDRCDVIAGDKGTGKTALFKILQARYRATPELENVELVTAFNPAGSPVFQRLTQEQLMTEGQYRSVWKAYFLSLVGNWALNIVGTDYSEAFKSLDEILTDAGLRANDDTPATVFGRIVNAIRKLQPTAAETSFTFSETGIPIVTPRVEFGRGEANGPREVRHEAALMLLDRCIEEMGIVVWILFDRLDEAFQGLPAFEIPALRALLRSYLDLLEYRHLRIKLFLRKDLFRRILGDGFVNLTHINARRIEIVWDEEDLLNLICERMKESGDFLRILGVDAEKNDRIFYTVFPEQVDVGERKPTTWNWIMGRIRDGNGIKPPRNLIDLVTKSKEAQLRRENRESRDFQIGLPIIEADSIRRGLSRLSEERVEDTLLAEVGDDAQYIEAFRGNRSEHSIESIQELLELEQEECDEVVRRLIQAGFLEKVGQSFKVPMLYRDGLSISQGKAF